ncbi:structural protein [Candidatus Pacearchaeota archaeon]|nr:structural protein [Candidatus Pacearchaeota archaeon]
MKYILIPLAFIILFVYSAPVKASLHNPGNICKGSNWVGMAEIQPEGRFVKFKNSEFGYRAMGKLMLIYNEKHRLGSLTQIINRYAPPFENPTQNYIDFVAKETGFTTWSYINVHNEEVLFLLVKAMAKFEQGRRFHDSDDTIRAGIKMALE